ncbi:MAG: excinuclease ABC subunit UvrA, partial [Clostridia bacterium]|nr:excinuclease ABC subunit UvrA [Clostridia bacterium]
ITLDKNIKHDIDIVVDRLIMRGPEMRSRLAESIETAAKLAGGIIKILFPDAPENDNEMLFSQNYACKTHGVSIGELTPRMFSFNNPSGACEACGGLGENNVFSEEKLIPDKSLSIYAGAIVCNGFKSAEPGGYLAELLNSVGRYHDFDVHTPIENFTEEGYNVLMYGNKRKRKSVSEPSFKGVIGMIEHRYKMGGGYESRDYYEQFMDFIPCPECKGRRLKNESLAVTVGGLNISDLCSLSVVDAHKFFNELKLSKTESEIAKEILKEIHARLSFLENVGLGYLTLSRKAGSLSGGEAQRIRLATQIGSSLVGVMYVLDEPSIGLHQRDNQKLINTLKKLRDIGNTVLVVEHDEETIEEADFLVDIGPGAGISGGEVVFTGTPAQIKKCKESITGQYLSGKKSVSIPKQRRSGNGGFITVVGAKENNLKDIDVTFPLGKFVCVTGVSGSGKSSLVNAVLYNTLARKLGRASLIPGKHREIIGAENIDKIIQIDQSPIGRNPRSNPATYIGLFNDIRAVFASTPEAKARGYGEGRFSFNVKGGRCESCRGDGTLTIEMHFLPDVYVTCDVCKGRRYNHETLEIKYKGKSIYDILEMTCEEGREFFQNYPSIKRKLDTLCDVGLGYVKIGQPATTLSGGEAQRVKLANELARRATGKTLYVLDEPTTGLHTDDVNKLVSVLQKLVDAGNSVVVIEHNLDLIKTADYIIDLGPEGGAAGGTVIAKGTPEEVAENPNSYTGYYLKEKLK